MRLLFSQLVAVTCLVGLFCAANAGDDKTDQRIQKLRKDLADLHEKEKALKKQAQDIAKAIADLERQARLKADELKRKADELKRQAELERKKKLEAEKKRHYVKIELRGILTRAYPFGPGVAVNHWHLVTGETKWPLVFSKLDPALAKTVLKTVGEPVIVTGTISTAKRVGSPHYPLYPGSSPWSPGSSIPDGSTFPPFGPGGRYPSSINWELAQPTVIVETIRAVAIK